MPNKLRCVKNSATTPQGNFILTKEAIYIFALASSREEKSHQRVR